LPLFCRKGRERRSEHGQQDENLLINAHGT
jgi:hypothetical protein